MDHPDLSAAVAKWMAWKRMEVEGCGDEVRSSEEADRMDGGVGQRMSRCKEDSTEKERRS